MERRSKKRQSSVDDEHSEEDDEIQNAKKRRRSPRKTNGGKKDSKATADKSNSSKTITKDENDGRRTSIFVMPEALLQAENDSSCTLGPDIVSLRHPKLGTKAMFLMTKDDSEICEILCHKDGQRSWFVGDCVQQEGSLFVSTPVDPLFLIIPYLQKVDKYMLLDQLLTDEEFPSASRLVSCARLVKNLEKIADSKKYGDDRVYRINESRILDWLQKKVDKLVSVLKEKKIYVGAGSRIATFVQSKKENAPQTIDYVEFAAGMLLEYLPDNFTNIFYKHLGLEDRLEGEMPDTSLAPKPKLKPSKAMEPTENYGDRGDGPKTKPEKKPAKLTLAQKLLSKVDKSGMKSISSFFNKNK